MSNLKGCNIQRKEQEKTAPFLSSVLTVNCPVNGLLPMSNIMLLLGANFVTFVNVPYSEAISHCSVALRKHF